MSIPALQQQLATTRLGDVRLQRYFEQLCKSLGAAMIGDTKELFIEVTVDESVAKADVSVSLGLIVTELVINALKHAFPGHRHGKIAVDYHANSANWSLSVSDNGVGIPADPASAKPGLGTGIIEAMAKQLGAAFTISDGKPGTKASVIGKASVVPKKGPQRRSLRPTRDRAQRQIPLSGDEQDRRPLGVPYRFPNMSRPPAISDFSTLIFQINGQLVHQTARRADVGVFGRLLESRAEVGDGLETECAA